MNGKATRKLVQLIAAVAMCAAASAVLYVRSHDVGPLPEGPLRLAPGEATFSTKRDVGEPLAVAIHSRSDTQAADVVLEAVRPLHPSGLVFLGARVVRTTPEFGYIGAALRWPPDHGHWSSHPLPGWHYQVGDEILAGVKATKPGYYQMQGFVIRYRVGDQTFESISRMGAGICGPSVRYPDGCTES